MMTMTETRETPRVWVGCLACYNGGKLRGEWVDALEAGEFVPCEDRGHEEWWCMDLEGFGGLLTTECSPMEAQKVAEVIGELDAWQPVEAFAAWCDNAGEAASADLIEQFADDYCGEYNSEQEYAQELADDLGFVDPEAAWPASYIDWERATRDLFMGDYWSADADSGRVYVFRTS